MYASNYPYYPLLTLPLTSTERIKHVYLDLVGVLFLNRMTLAVAAPKNTNGGVPRVLLVKPVSANCCQETLPFRTKNISDLGLLLPFALVR